MHDVCMADVAGATLWWSCGTEKPGARVQHRLSKETVKIRASVPVRRSSVPAQTLRFMNARRKSDILEESF